METLFLRMGNFVPDCVWAVLADQNHIYKNINSFLKHVFVSASKQTPTRSWRAPTPYIPVPITLYLYNIMLIIRFCEL